MKDIVLTFDYVENELADAIIKHERKLGYPLKGLVLSNIDLQDVKNRITDPNGIFTEIFCDFEDPADIELKLAPYVDKLLLATARIERSIQHFAKTIPFLHGLNLPTIESLYDSSHKKLMRDKLKMHDETLTPKYLYMDDDDIESVSREVQSFTYPVIVKPSGLSKSLLVSVCYTDEELRETLKLTLDKINGIYESSHYPGNPSLLIEEMIHGDMYSLDAYVLPDGEVYCLPLIRILTAHAVGLKGFYGYDQSTVVSLSHEDRQAAEVTAIKSIRALNLKATTVHIELFHTPKGWKIIELGARIGGYRGMLYKHAYNIDHFHNDLLIRMGLKPVVKKEAIGYAKALKFYAESEGTITKIEGIEILNDHQLIEDFKLTAELGDQAVHSHNGGDPLLQVKLRSDDEYLLESVTHELRNSIKFHVS